MPIENVELMLLVTHKCSLSHFGMGTVRFKDKEAEEEGKQKRVKMEISKIGMT